MMNTANKRASAIGIALAFRLVLPVPDSTISQGDRQQTAYSYAGIVAAFPVIAPADIVTIDATIHRMVTLDATLHRVLLVDAHIRDTVVVDANVTRTADLDATVRRTVTIVTER